MAKKFSQFSPNPSPALADTCAGLHSGANTLTSLAQIVALTNFAAPGTYGDATHTTQMVVNSGQQVSAMSNIEIEIPSTQVTDFNAAATAEANAAISTAIGTTVQAHNAGLDALVALATRGPINKNSSTTYYVGAGKTISADSFNNLTDGVTYDDVVTMNSSNAKTVTVDATGLGVGYKFYVMPTSFTGITSFVGINGTTLYGQVAYSAPTDAAHVLLVEVKYVASGIFQLHAVPNLFGLASMAFQSLMSVAITGGTIDGTNVGVTVPGIGQFSQLSLMNGIVPSNIVSSASSLRSYTFQDKTYTLADATGDTTMVKVGTLTTGTWNATVIAGQYGGTGVANTGKTITLGGNLATSGANAVTLTTTGTTNVTLPTTGTLAAITQGTLTTNWSGIYAAPIAGNIVYSLVNNVVTLKVPLITATGTTAAGLGSTANLPAALIPSQNTNGYFSVMNSGVNVDGKWTVNTSGTITFTVGQYANFSGSGTSGVNPGAITYIV